MAFLPIDADIAILDAIDAMFSEQTQDGQKLESIAQYYVMRTEYEMPPDFGTSFPAVRIRMLPLTGEIVSIPACMTRMQCPVEFQVYTEQAGRYVDKTASELINLIHEVFWQHQLGISNLLIHFTSKDYSLPTEIPFAERLNGGATLVYTYEYTDTRSIPD